ncbi:tyrosine-type recombinase/integrase [Leptospira interrogans]
MSSRVKLTEAFLKDLRDGKLEKGYYGDTEVPRLFVRRLRTGSVVFIYRYSAGKQQTVSLGVWGKDLTLTQARREAEKRKGQIAEGRDPAAERSAARRHAKAAEVDTVNYVLDLYLEEEVRGRLRTAKQIESMFDRLVRPAIGERSIYSLEAGDLTELFDGIATSNGRFTKRTRRTTAARTKAWLRAAFNFWGGRGRVKFPNPITKGTYRVSAVGSERDRLMTEEEIRDVLVAVEQAKLPDAFRRCVWMMILTGLRLSDIAKAKWEDMTSDGRWIVPASRFKTKVEHVIPLTAEVLRLLGPRRNSGYCFSTMPDASKPIQGFSKWKLKLDKEISALRKKRRRGKMEEWQLNRDSRRTHRSLMGDLGIADDVGERVQGRAIQGARRTYDRSAYETSKREALERVAARIDKIMGSRDP